MKEDRYQKILDLLSNGEYMSVEKLSRTLYVSMPTIRRDLTEMQEMGLVVRSHGGVVQRRIDSDGAPSLFRMGVHSGAKLKLANAASRFLHDDAVIFMDESTTTLHIIDHMPDYKNITVVTSSLNVLNMLQKYKIPAYCLGGRFEYDNLCFYGSDTESMLNHFYIDTMFFSSSAVTPNGMIADYQEEANSLRRKALKKAETKIFLCDSSKFGKSGAHILLPLRDADYIIVDAPLPEAYNCDPSKVIVC